MTRRCFVVEGDWLADRTPGGGAVRADAFVQLEDEVAVSLFAADRVEWQNAVALGSEPLVALLFARRDELESARAQLLAVLSGETDRVERGYIEAAGRLGGTQVREALERMLDRSQSGVSMRQRVAAACAILRLDPTHHDAAETLAEVCDNDDPSARVALSNFVRIYDPLSRLPATRRVVEAVARWATYDNWKRFPAALPLLLYERPREALTRLQEGLSHSDPEVRRRVAASVRGIRGPLSRAARKLLAERLSAEEDIAVGLEILASSPTFASVETVSGLLMKALVDISPTIRGRALALAWCVDPRVGRPLVEAAISDEPDPYVRALAQRVLELM